VTAHKTKILKCKHGKLLTTPKVVATPLLS